MARSALLPQAPLQLRTRSRHHRFRALDQRAAGWAAARAAHVAAAGPVHRHDHAAARTAVPGSQRRGLPQVSGWRRAILRPPHDDMRTGDVARVQPDVIGLRDLVRELVVRAGSAPDEDLDSA